MKRTLRRLGVSFLAVLLSLSMVTTSQAGLIPWLYDSIFGPHHGSPYHVGYGRCAPTFCQPVRCNPCAVSCAPTGTCRTGTPTTVAFYHPFYGTVVTRSACDAKTNWKSSGKEGDKAPEPKTTFAGSDPFNKEGATPMEVNRPKTPVEPEEGEEAGVVQASGEKAADQGEGASSSNPDNSEAGKEAVPGQIEDSASGTPASGADGTANSESPTGSEGDQKKETFKATQRDDDGEKFQPAKTSEDGEGADGSGKDGTQESESIEEGAECLCLEDVSTWKVRTPVRRVPFRPGYGHVRLARAKVQVQGDHALSPESITRIAGR